MGRALFLNNFALGSAYKIHYCHCSCWVGRTPTGDTFTWPCNDELVSATGTIGAFRDLAEFSSWRSGSQVVESH